MEQEVRVSGLVLVMFSCSADIVPTSGTSSLAGSIATCRIKEWLRLRRLELC